MSKKLSKAEVNFSRNTKQNLEAQAREKQPLSFGWNAPAYEPIHFPKRKKFKR